VKLLNSGTTTGSLSRNLGLITCASLMGAVFALGAALLIAAGSYVRTLRSVVTESNYGAGPGVK
jgi:hypothetical protein